MIPQTTFVPTFWTHIISELGGVKGYETAQKLKSTCIKQCRYKGSTLDVMEIRQKPMLPLGKDMNA